MPCTRSAIFSIVSHLAALSQYFFRRVVHSYLRSRAHIPAKTLLPQPKFFYPSQNPSASPISSTPGRTILQCTKIQAHQHPGTPTLPSHGISISHHGDLNEMRFSLTLVHVNTTTDIYRGIIRHTHMAVLACCCVSYERMCCCC